MSFIERLAQNKIGFYFWKLFLVDQIRCYEVSFAIINRQTLYFSIFTEIVVNIYGWLVIESQGTVVLRPIK